MSAAQAQYEYPVNERGRLYDPDVSADDRTYATFMHLTTLAHLVVPLAAIVIPIIMWNVKRKDSPYLDDHGREAINFQISLMLYSVLLPIVGMVVGFLLFFVGVVLTVPLAVALPFVLGLIGVIAASTAANRGEFYRYPVTIRFLA